MVLADGSLRTAMVDGHGGRPWQTAVMNKEVENLE
jgi:hypothetical protein